MILARTHSEIKCLFISVYKSPQISSLIIITIVVLLPRKKESVIPTLALIDRLFSRTVTYTRQISMTKLREIVERLCRSQCIHASTCDANDQCTTPKISFLIEINSFILTSILMIVVEVIRNEKKKIITANIF